MRIAYVIVVSIISFVFLIFMILFKDKSRAAHRSMFEAFIFAFLVMVSNVGIALSKSEISSYIFHSVFFSGIDYLILFFMIFCIRYTRGKEGKLPIVFFVICLLDTLQFIINLWTHHAFWIIKTSYQGSPFLSFDYTHFYVAHLFLCYIMLTIGLVCLVVDLVRSPGMYRIKYAYLLVTFVIATLIDATYLIYRTPLNWAVLSFAFISFGAYYFILVYAPLKLRTDTMQFVSNTMNSGLLILDKDDGLIYMNDYFKEYFSADSEDITGNLIDVWSSHWSLSYLDEFTKDIEERLNGDKRYYRLQFHRFESKKKKYLGCFFLVTDTTKDMEKLKQEHYYATHDRLTGVYSREYFYQKVEQRIKDNPDTEYMMLCSDIANFKFINEMFGTSAADFILKQFSQMLQDKCLPEDVYGRLDNDHFVLLTPKRRYKEEFFLDVTNQIMSKIDETIGTFFNCYIGVYEVKNDIFVRSMSDRCMLAIRSIKGSNKRLAYYTEDMSSQILLEQEVTGDLNRALEAGEIVMYIQPQVNSNGETLGGEALVRWNHAEKGLLPPYLFIPVFEKNGRITDIDLYIWEKACQQIAKWESEGLDLYLSVNISPKDLVVLDICGIFTGLADKYKINRKHLKLEITETAAMYSVADTEDLIARLHKEGFIVEMDDFGSGYSSLNMLKDISVDVVKLDMAFLRESPHKERARTILESMISLAKNLSLGIVVEGVETKENLDFLVAEGCECFQGYYFAKPMPISDFENRIKK